MTQPRRPSQLVQDKKILVPKEKSEDIPHDDNEEKENGDGVRSEGICLMV